MSSKYSTPLDSFAAIVRRIMSFTDYFAHYRGKITAQSADMLGVDFEPDDSTRLPKMLGIPLRLGVPGVRALLQLPCNAIVGWAAGDPGQPYATTFDSGESIVSISFAGGASGVAREGDVVLGTVDPATLAAFLAACTAGPYPVVAAGALAIEVATIGSVLSASTKVLA